VLRCSTHFPYCHHHFMQWFHAFTEEIGICCFWPSCCWTRRDKLAYVDCLLVANALSESIYGNWQMS
jgi:hypothetical protein